MRKKDFDSINAMKAVKASTGADTGKIHEETIERRKETYQQQVTASPQEQAERAAELKTQGRKGCKAARINFAFTPENYDYIRTVSTATGQSMTHFLNQIIKDYRNIHPEIYEKAKSVLAQVQAVTDAETKQ